MKRKYVTIGVLLACLTKHSGLKKNIHELLEETITERKTIIEQWENAFLSKNSTGRKDIHAQLKETITERKRILEQWEKLFAEEKETGMVMPDKIAA